MQAGRDPHKKLLETQYKLEEVELGAIVAECPVDWKALVSAASISYEKIVSLADAPVELVLIHAIDRESREDSLRTPMVSELE